MPRKSRKSRPNEIGIALSDASSRSVKLAKWTPEGGRKVMIVGCARTSTADQTVGLAAQERDLEAAGQARRVNVVEKDGVAPRCSGASPNRPIHASGSRARSGSGGII